MREALFIKKNKDRWLKNQYMPAEDADEMASDFTQLVDDLAYAKTFYPSGKVTQYINTQASRIYLSIYKNRKEESNRLVTFWKYDLPLTIRKHYKAMLFAFVVFMVFFAIGFFTSKQDEDVARSFLGDEYVDQTLENIEKGNPFGVYEHGNPVLSWLGIMINNIIVAFRSFVGGIFAGALTFYELAQFGVMVGVFDELFASKGLGLQFFLVVFIHGTLEITGYIIVGGAGFVLGKSFLFPGTLKRLDAFKQGAKDGVKIMIGLMPVFALAAFFEGFITRLYNDSSVFEKFIPRLSNGVSILTTIVVSLSVLFVVWYFIIYPILLGRRYGYPGIKGTGIVKGLLQITRMSKTICLLLFISLALVVNSQAEQDTLLLTLPPDTTAVTAMDEEVAVPDTTIYAGDEYYDKEEDSSSVEAVFFLQKWMTGSLADSFQLRHLTDSAAKAMHNDKDFWYANTVFKKKAPEQEVKPQRKRFWDLPFINALLWLLIIGGFITFLILFLANSNVKIFRGSKTIAAVEGEEETGDIFSINYQREIDRAVQAGDYRQATRFMFLRLLRNLSDKHIIEYKHDRTNFDYLLQLHNTKWYEDFFQLARHYEYAWYGEFEVSRDKFDVIKNEFQKFENRLDNR